MDAAEPPPGGLDFREAVGPVAPRSIHSTMHEEGGPDELGGLLAANARVSIALEGATVGARRQVNIIQGDGVVVTVTDDAPNEQVDVEVAMDLSFLAETGDIKESLQTGNHGSWLLCNGGSFSGATFPNLQALLGGTTLPDLRGRSPMGSGTGSGLTARTLKASIGEESHTMVISEIAAHTHTQNSHNHTQNSHNHTQDSHNHTQQSHAHFVEDDSGFQRAIVADRALTNYTPSSLGNTEGTTAVNLPTTATNVATTAVNNATTATNTNTGSGTPFNVVHPVYVVNFFIYAA